MILIVTSGFSMLRPAEPAERCRRRHHTQRAASRGLPPRAVGRLPPTDPTPPPPPRPAALSVHAKTYDSIGPCHLQSEGRYPWTPPGPGAQIIYVLNDHDGIHGSIVQLNFAAQASRRLCRSQFSSVSVHAGPFRLAKSANGRHAYDLDITDL